jgi:hypothetical protein
MKQVNCSKKQKLVLGINYIDYSVMKNKTNIWFQKSILALLFISLPISCFSVEKEKRNLAQKEVFTMGFPKTLSFRNDMFGLEEGYDFWERTYLGFNSITKKYLTEEMDINPIIPQYANKFALNHPEKLMLLHLNGEGISVKNKEVHQTYFPGHWIYEAGSLLSADIDKNDNKIVVQSAKPFSKNAYIIHRNRSRLGTLPHDVIIVEIDKDGNRLWNQSEFATIEDIDKENNTITVIRGKYFSTPRSFKKGSTYIAPLAGDSWGGNLMWYYNLSSTCPKDKNGNTCSDVFLSQIKSWFSKDGILENIDGIGYDVNYFTADHKTWDCNNDGIADKGFVNGKNVWREGDWQFLQNLRNSFGPEFIITADGWKDDMQRAVGILNGMESEGLCAPNDGYRQISRTINQHTYWNLYNNAKYKFSYITSKLNNPADENFSTQLHRLGIGLATCLEVAYTCNPKHVPEANGGLLNQPNWLGQPVSELFYTAKQTPDLLNGMGLNMDDKLIKQFNFENADYKVDKNTLSIKGKQDNPYSDIVIEGPEINIVDGDLIVFLEAKAIQGFTDFKQTDRVPRKINIKINGSPAYTLTKDSTRMLAMHNELAGFMGTAGFTPLSFYFRKVGNKNSPIRLTFEVEEQGEFAIRNLTVHNAACTMAREFENGVVLVNPTFDSYDFNLKELFPKNKKYKHIKVENSKDNGLLDDSNEVSSYNNGEKIIDASKVSVPGLNALFLIKK